MAKAKTRVFSRTFKVAAINRMLAGENVSALARELSLRRKLLYEWRDALRGGGPEALRPPGRPRKTAVASGGKPLASEPAATELVAARQRIAELERKVGQQQLDLDFFKRALRHVGTSRQPSNRRGAPASTPSSRR
jgi:transposase-like protein